jgi:L-histidine Nalpha-methyltransferase
MIMQAKYELVEDAATSATFKEALALDVLIGLTEVQKAIPSKHFYDEEGSRLFQLIMDLPEYYPTKCEFEILNDHREQIAEMLKDRPFNLVELGPETQPRRVFFSAISSVQTRGFSTCR